MKVKCLEYKKKEDFQNSFLTVHYPLQLRCLALVFFHEKHQNEEVEKGRLVDFEQKKKKNKHKNKILPGCIMEMFVGESKHCLLL